MMSFREFLSTRSRASLVVIAVVLVAAIGSADYLTGYDLSFGLFYIAPISILSWYVSRRAGVAFALLSALVWYWVNSASAPAHIGQAVIVWNTAVRFGFFGLISFLLSSLEETYEHQKELARIDSLTGLLNNRAFKEQAHIELMRARRNNHRVAVLYLDLDNFKALNDSRGHAMGDSLLRGIGQALRNNTRSTELVGRLGGDEFVVLLSDTTQPQAQAAASRFQATILSVTANQDPPVTVTIGAVTSDGTEAIESLISRADRAMYEGKALSRGSVHLGPNYGDAEPLSP